jgi:hypothetical protein
MNHLPRLLLKILRANPALGENRLMSYIVIRRPYAHLEAELRPFEEQGDIKVLVDKRHGERRVVRADASPPERRAADRRTAGEELLEVVILNGP